LLARAEAALISDLAQGRRPSGAYDLKSALRLIRTPQTPPEVGARIEALVRDVAAGLDPIDPHGPALEFAPEPGQRLAELFEVEAALERLVAEQESDGRWSPFWEWSETDPQAWLGARADWRGILSRQAVQALLAHGRKEAA
jgi:hypothetical protein